MPLFAPRGCIEPDAPDPTGLWLFAGHTDTTAALRWFAGQTGRLFADPAAGLRSGGIKPPRSPRISIPLPAFGTAQQPRPSASGFLARQKQRRQLRIVDRAATMQRRCVRVRAIVRALPQIGQ